MEVLLMPELTYEIWYLNYEKVMRRGAITHVYTLPGHEFFNRYFPDSYECIVPLLVPLDNKADVPYGGEIHFLEHIFLGWQDPPHGPRSMAVGDVIVLKENDITLICLVRAEGWYMVPRFAPEALYNKAVARILSALIFTSP